MAVLRARAIVVSAFGCLVLSACATPSNRADLLKWPDAIDSAALDTAELSELARQQPASITFPDGVTNIRERLIDGGRDWGGSFTDPNTGRIFYVLKTLNRQTGNARSLSVMTKLPNGKVLESFTWFAPDGHTPVATGTVSPAN